MTTTARTAAAVLVVLAVLLAARMVAVQLRTPPPALPTAPARAAAPAPDTSANAAARQAALARFTGMPGIRHVEWHDGDLLLAATDNGQSWQPVADAACAWTRQQGYQGAFAVVVLEAAALRNQRWQQLARARCA